MKNLLGIDIGGTKCAVILGKHDETGDTISICDKIFMPTESHMGPSYMLEKIYQSIDQILLENKVDTGEISSIGISCGGPLDSKEGVIMSPPNLPGWDDVHITQMFMQRYNIKTKLQNDANACALAEWKFGAGKGYNNMAFLTFGTGMGAGLILNGKLYSGTNDMAGEIGHVRLAKNGPVGYGKSGSFEGFCSGGGIAQLAKTKVLEKLQMGQSVSFCRDMDELHTLTAKKIALAAKDGDELALEIFACVGQYLGKGLSIIIDILNPEIIIIGSIFSRAKDLLWPHAQAVIKKEALIHTEAVCKVVASGLGEQIGDYAALAVALNE